MKNKKAWIRIVEAFIGIMIIMVGVLAILSKQPLKSDISEEVYEKQRQILEIIANNNDMREEIIDGGTNLADAYILKNIPETWGFKTNICEVDQVCNFDTPNDRDLYISETIISANLANYPNEKSKKLVFFVWRK